VYLFSDSGKNPKDHPPTPLSGIDQISTFGYCPLSEQIISSSESSGLSTA